jgi:hypothetical protein
MRKHIILLIVCTVSLILCLGATIHPIQESIEDGYVCYRYAWVPKDHSTVVGKKYEKSEAVDLKFIEDGKKGMHSRGPSFGTGLTRTSSIPHQSTYSPTPNKGSQYKFKSHDAATKDTTKKCISAQMHYPNCYKIIMAYLQTWSKDYICHSILKY